MTENQRELTYKIAVGLGLAATIGTAMIEKLSFLGYVLGSFTTLLLFPGLLCSMAFAGNVHAYSLFPAAVANFIFYFCLTWGVSFVVSRFRHGRASS
ncbi:MAG TPA: hypothetical protein VLZ50_06105 [Terracidiphilus sp.]|nr:hypothetical protein [Terracidiphilus sp.]